jgi:hypothetical protein
MNYTTALGPHVNTCAEHGPVMDCTAVVHYRHLSRANNFMHNIKTRQRVGWCSGRALDLYSGDDRFESRPGHGLS